MEGRDTDRKERRSNYLKINGHFGKVSKFKQNHSMNLIVTNNIKGSHTKNKTFYLPPYPVYF